MNYFPFHIGDYTTHTAHLEPMEDLAYRRLMDQYYLREGELPEDVSECARITRLKDHVKAVEAVLNEFFDLTDKGWFHSRCDEELRRMKDKQTKAKASAQASVNARSTNAQRTLNEGSATNTNTNTNKTPLPPKGEPKGFKEFYEAYPRKQGRAPAAKAFAKVDVPIARLIAAIELQKRSEQWTKDGGQFIPLPATWLNQRRWEDQIDATAFAHGRDPDSRVCVEEDGVSLGLGRWDDTREQWPTYKARVRAAQGVTA